MKRLLIVVLLMGVLAACGSSKDEVEESSGVKDEAVKENEEKSEEAKEEEVKEQGENKDESVKTEEPTKEAEAETETKSEQKQSEKPAESTKKSAEKTETETKPKAENKPKTESKVETEPKKEVKPNKKTETEKKPVVKDENIEQAAENIIWAQNNRDYKVLEGYLGQNITLNKNNNTLKITNVDYPQEAELVKGIKQEDLEHRFTEKTGKDHIVGFAAIDHDREMSYTIDLTMRLGEDSWKMLNMQINK